MAATTPTKCARCYPYLKRSWSGWHAPADRTLAFCFIGWVIRKFHNNGGGTYWVIYNYGLTNYGPVSLTSITCKIFERIFKKALLSSLSETRAMLPHQCNVASSSTQCTEAANKATRLIFMIRRSFQDLSKSAFIPFHEAILRPHLE